MVEQFVGTWKIISSENFDELLKEFGKSIIIYWMSGSISEYLQNPERKFKLNEPFLEQVLNNKDMRAVITLENGKLFQKLLEGDGKFTVEREISEGKMIVRSRMGNVVAVRTFEKEE
uniref:Cytosolic fatty-acid binding proteins domain-containing protein n=1 Tax=Xiphophorus maculatus TaxID=8083 RepID=A0A3B5RB55_XIPMA